MRGLENILVAVAKLAATFRSKLRHKNYTKFDSYERKPHKFNLFCIGCILEGQLVEEKGFGQISLKTKVSKIRQ